MGSHWQSQKRRHLFSGRVSGKRPPVGSWGCAAPARGRAFLFLLPSGFMAFASICDSMMMISNSNGFCGFQLCALASPSSFSFTGFNARSQGRRDAKLRWMRPRFSTYARRLPLATTETSEIGGFWEAGRHRDHCTRECDGVNRERRRIIAGMSKRTKEHRRTRAASAPNAEDRESTPDRGRSFFLNPQRLSDNTLKWQL